MKQFHGNDSLPLPTDNSSQMYCSTVESQEDRWYHYSKNRGCFDERNTLRLIFYAASNGGLPRMLDRLQ